MMWGYGTGIGSLGLVLMTISNILFWALIIFGVILLVRYLTHSNRPTGGQPGGRATPEQVLAERFAAGEIDEQEYRHRLEVLRGQQQPLAKP